MDLPDERTLAHLWRFRTWPADLRTTSGARLEIIHRGRPAGGPGPDFCDALLRLDEGPLRSGDVELHVRESDWHAHRHAGDPRYARVILHVVWLADGPPAAIGGQPIPTLALAGLVPGTALSPPTGQPPVEPCHRWLCALPDEALGRLLDRLGEARLTERAALYEGALAAQDPSQVLYTALGEALGYSQNRRPFRDLTERLPWADLVARAGQGADRRQRAEALLLGAAGLLPEHPPADPTGAAHWRALRTHWLALGQPWHPLRLARSAWQWSGGRPANAPPRRLAALAHLSLTDLCTHPATILPTALEPEGRRPGRRLRRWAQVDAEGYWADHADFGRPLSRPAALVGAARADDIAVNVLLPLTLALEPGLADRVRSVYRRYPALADNTVTRLMLAQIGGERRRPLLRTACRQQGLLYLYRRCCCARQCPACPLAAEIGAGAAAPDSPDRPQPSGAAHA